MLLLSVLLLSLLSAGCASAATCSLTRNSWVNVTVTVSGRERWSMVYVPSSATTAAPLVLSLHWWGGTAENMESAAMYYYATAAGWITACPQGYENTWNAGLIAPPATTQNIDDIGFFKALVSSLVSQGCVNASRVYSWGISNGGFMSWRNACQASEVFAAIVSVSGLMGDVSNQATYYTCSPTRAVPVLHFHGLNDTTVPYDGVNAFSTNARGSNSSYYWWVANNGCDTETTVSLKSGDMTCITPKSCPAHTNVTLCSIAGGTHSLTFDYQLAFNFIKSYTLETTASAVADESSTPVLEDVSSSPAQASVVQVTSSVTPVASSDAVVSGTISSEEPVAVASDTGMSSRGTLGVICLFASLLAAAL